MTSADASVTLSHNFRYSSSVPERESKLGGKRNRVIPLDRHRLCLLRVLNGVDLCTGMVPLTPELLAQDLLTPNPRGKELTSRISLRSLYREIHTQCLTDSQPAERAKQFDHISLSSYKAYREQTHSITHTWR